MTIEDLRRGKMILLECISGSRAYGLNTPTSDTDIKGVFYLPKSSFYGLNYTKQINNESNDIVFYELGRFMELLSQNNPNILELLNTPEDSIIYRSTLINRIDASKIISKRCQDTFGKYAISQIKKARGLNKKIVNPVSKERKTPLDFCFVVQAGGSWSLRKYLEIQGWDQKNCGLVNIPHMKDVFGLYHSGDHLYDGIIRHDTSNDVCMSSVPKGEVQSAILYFNRDGYSTYCKDYREYWTWVDKRNDERFKSTSEHGKNYDAKNMMHTFRLLHMAIEIAKEGSINVRRSDRDFLLEIKSGKFEYEDLLKMAEEKQSEMDAAFEKCSLPELPDYNYIERLTVELRELLYK